MSSTVSPASDTSGSAARKERNTTGVTHIDLSLQSEQDVRYQLVPVSSRCPVDEPYWCDHAEISPARGLQPFTLRYLALHKVTSSEIEGRDKIRSALWHRISEVLADSKASGVPLPSIMFDQSTLPGDGQQGVIDLVFASASAYLVICDRIDKQIHIAGLDGSSSAQVYQFDCATNSLDGSILVVECLRLPLSKLDVQGVMAAFGVMAKPLGTVLGIASIIVTSDERDVQEESSDAVRCYVQLAPDKMTTPWKETIITLPTHFVCNGVPYTLRYSGVELHKEKVFSTSFDIPVKVEQAQQSAVSPSSDKRARTATDATSDSNNTAKKKVRRSNE